MTNELTSEEQLIQPSKWLVSRARSDAKLTLDMQEVYILEARKDDLASVNKVNAKPLMRAFERGFGIVGSHFAKVKKECDLLEIDIQTRRGYILLQVAPTKLKELGLTTKASPGGSVELREAVVSQDLTYIAMADKLAELESFKELLKQKMEGFKMSYYSVKEVYDSLSNPIGNSDEVEASLP